MRDLPSPRLTEIDNRRFHLSPIFAATPSTGTFATYHTRDATRRKVSQPHARPNEQRADTPGRNEHMIPPATYRHLAAGGALAAAALFAAPALADSCSDLANLVLPEVTSIAATSFAANTFSLPPPFPGLPPGPPVPV